MKNYLAAIARARLSVLAIFAVLVLSACQRAELSSIDSTPTPAANTAAARQKVDRPVSEPYTGQLSIFEDPERAKKLQVDRVMDVLKISDGKNVADIGAGSGWFSTRAAKRIGERGKVFAVEINRDYIDYINERTKKDGITNIQTILGSEDDPKLPAESIDAVLILKTYHEIAQPIAVLENLKRSLKKDALVGIIDKNGKGDDHGLDKQKVIDEAKRAGFTLKEEHDFTKGDGMDYFLVFQASSRAGEASTRK